MPLDTPTSEDYAEKRPELFDDYARHLLTVEEVAELCGLTDRTVKRWFNGRFPPGLRPKRHEYVPVEEFLLLYRWFANAS